MAFWPAVLERVKRAVAVVIENNHFAIDQRRLDNLITVAIFFANSSNL